MSGSDIWGGVEPPGRRPIRQRYRFLMGLIGLMLIEWILWLLYRYISYPIIESAFSKLGFIFHILAAPLIGLTPIFLFWRFVLKEKGLPWKFTKKNLFSSVIVGALSAVLLMLLYQIANWSILSFTGFGVPSRTYLISLWRSSDVIWLVLMTFTFFFIVGPVEELQYRSFLQDQIGRAFKPSTGLLIASTMFALSHLPIYFIVYRLDPVQTLFTLCWTFTMGSVLGMFYFRSRNIMGPIIMHGLWNWILSIFVLDIGLKEAFYGIGYFQEILWLLALIPAAFITLFFINIFYVALWKNERPQGSFGIGRMPYLDSLVERIGGSIGKTRAIRSLMLIDSKRYSLPQKALWSIIGVVTICSLVMLLTLPGVTLDEVVLKRASSTTGQEDMEKEVTISFDEGYYINEGKDKVLDLDINSTAIIKKVSFSLIWTEENEPRPWMVNEPDTFRITIIGNQEVLASDEGDSGSLSVLWEDQKGNMTMGDTIIVVYCVEAGDLHPRFIDIGGFRDEEDTGNDVTVSLQVTYLE